MSTTRNDMMFQEQDAFLKRPYKVILLSCHQFKILYSVILAIPIDMMNMFIRTQRPSHLFCHAKAMFVNLISLITHRSKRMIRRNRNSNITVLGKVFTAFPIMMSRPKDMSTGTISTETSKFARMEQSNATT